MDEMYKYLEIKNHLNHILYKFLYYYVMMKIYLFYSILIIFKILYIHTEISEFAVFDKDLDVVFLISFIIFSLLVDSGKEQEKDFLIDNG